MTFSRNPSERLALTGLGALLLVFLLLPIVALFATSTVTGFVAGLRYPLVIPAMLLSIVTTSVSLLVVVILGTPLAWVLARGSCPWLRWIEVLLELPIVIPPAVAGVALLLAFGRHGLLAGWLYPVGWSVTFTTAAVVMAEVFVSAPFFVRAAISAFRRLDEGLVVVARSFGASPLRILFRVAIPMAAPGLVAGGALSWARALGEFGATLMFAGNLQGKTQTLPLAIYTALEGDLRAAHSISIVLVCVAFGLLGLLRLVTRPNALPTGYPH
jgi:molybdate transport system permease protein